MKILLDECLPKKLKQHFIEYDIATVPEMGWAGRKNGELLTLMMDDFDVFMTIDSNMSYQQNLADYPIALLLFSANSNRLEDLLPLVPDTKKALETIQRGTIIKVGQV